MPESLIEPTPDAQDGFYDGALRRVRLLMLVLGPLATIGAWAFLGWPAAIGVAAGCATTYFNFHWLKQVVTGLAERVTRTGESTSGHGIVYRFLLRYVLLGLGIYAIFRVSPASLDGFLGGLFLAAVAILCEAGYETYHALRHSG